MIRKLSKDATITLAMLAVSLMVLSIGLYRETVRKALVKRTIYDLSGKAIATAPGHWRAILVGSIDDDAALIHALQVGKDHRDHGAGPRLDTIVLAAEDGRAISAYATRSGAKVTMASLDQNMPFARALLNLETTRSQLFLFDANEHLVFRGGKPRPSDVSLLLQRYLPTTEYGRPIQVGDALAIEKLIDLKTLRPVAVPQTPVLAIVFTGRCTACALDNYLASTRAVEPALLRHSASRHLVPALVFTSFFNAEKVHTRLSELGFTMPAYEAGSDLPGIDYVGDHNSVDVLVVETDGQGRVVQVAPLNSFLQTLMETQA
jgi:hypothetical protein